MAYADAGAPKKGRGIDNLDKEPQLKAEAVKLIAQINDPSKVFRSKPNNGFVESDNLHADALTIGGAYTYKVEIQRKKGNKNTVANCIAKGTASMADIQAALLGSLGNQHNWTAE